MALPLARPALAAGAALALMECLNDLGAVQYLGVQTLTVSIYTTWLQRSSLGGAAQIALVALLFVLALLLAERAARGSSRFHHTTGRYRSIPFSDLEGWRGYAAAAFCCLPVLAGFVAPFAVLLVQASAHVSDALAAGFWRAVRNSVGVAAVAAVVTVAVGLVLAYARRLAPNAFVRTAVRAAGLGYALPGTVLALGLLHPARRARQPHRCPGARPARHLHRPAAVGQPVRDRARLRHPLPGRVARCAWRPASSASRPTSMPPRARWARRRCRRSWRVHMPLLLPALGAAALLVFVDAMKELPATLLLRPFNFETLATHVYSYAALEQFEQAALGALTIVAHRPGARAAAAPGGGRRPGGCGQFPPRSKVMPALCRLAARQMLGSSASWAWPIAWRSRRRACRSRR